MYSMRRTTYDIMAVNVITHKIKSVTTVFTTTDLQLIYIYKKLPCKHKEN